LRYAAFFAAARFAGAFFAARFTVFFAATFFVAETFLTAFFGAAFFAAVLFAPGFFAMVSPAESILARFRSNNIPFFYCFRVRTGTDATCRSAHQHASRPSGSRKARLLKRRCCAGQPSRQSADTRGRPACADAKENRGDAFYAAGDNFEGAERIRRLAVAAAEAGIRDGAGHAWRLADLGRAAADRLDPLKVSPASIIDSKAVPELQYDYGYQKQPPFRWPKPLWRVVKAER
jgi:hypothetical protein